jgi:WKF domain
LGSHFGRQTADTKLSTGCLKRRKGEGVPANHLKNSFPALTMDASTSVATTKDESAMADNAESQPQAIKKTRRRNRVSKHMQAARQLKADPLGANVPSSSNNASDTKKRPVEQIRNSEAKRSKHIKDPQEAAEYLLQWKRSRSIEGNPTTWKFKKNIQSWLLRHMYDSTKVSKHCFAVLLEYLQPESSSAPAALKDKVIFQATKRVVRYRQWEQRKESTQSEATPDSTQNQAGGLEENPTAQEQEENEHDEQRWRSLDDHDKRKEYKRARKVLETFTSTVSKDDAAAGDSIK